MQSETIPAEGVASTLERGGAPPCGYLPPRMRVLYVTTPARAGSRLAEAFAADSASDVNLEEAIGFAEGLSALRDQVFDAVLVSHNPGTLDALALVEGMRAGGSEEPVVVLGEIDDGELYAHAFEVDADAYVCVGSTTVRTLLWLIARAIERRGLMRENRRLVQAERRRLQLEQTEAQRLLAEQRAVAAQSDQPSTQPDELVAHYRGLLRALVIMGSGSLTREPAELAEVLASAGVGGFQALDLHVGVLEEQVRGLGNRGARHVVNRAGLLALDLLVNLCDCYRRLAIERASPVCQQLLPGFDSTAERAVV